MFTATHLLACACMLLRAKGGCHQPAAPSAAVPLLLHGDPGRCCSSTSRSGDVSVCLGCYPGSAQLPPAGGDARWGRGDPTGEGPFGAHPWGCGLPAVCAESSVMDLGSWQILNIVGASLGSTTLCFQQAGGLGAPEGGNNTHRVYSCSVKHTSVCSKGSDSPGFPPQQAELSAGGSWCTSGHGRGVTKLQQLHRSPWEQGSSSFHQDTSALRGGGCGERQQEPGVKGGRSDASRCQGGDGFSLFLWDPSCPSAGTGTGCG